MFRSTPQNSSKVNVLCVFDIDGTLADDSAREHIPSSIFFSNHQLLRSLPSNSDVVSVAKEFAADHSVQVHFVTGRSEDTREPTQFWLNSVLPKSLFVNAPKLFMRPSYLESDSRRTSKAEQLVNLLSTHPFTSLKIWDDDSRMLGLYALNVVDDDLNLRIPTNFYHVVDGKPKPWYR